MALYMLRGCFRLPSTFHCSRAFLNEGVSLKRSGNTRLPLSSPAAVVAAVRLYSSDQGGRDQHKKMVVVNIPNPFIWIRSRIFYFLIRTYMDQEFDIDEFNEGAKQAFSHVSRLLSQCHFEALEGLVAKDLIAKLEEKCNEMPSSHREALSADPDKIMYMTPGDVGISYDNGRKFVSILVTFWYLTSAHLPDSSLKEAGVFKMEFGNKGEAEKRRVINANYVFKREFTKGVPPAWIITRIEHSKLLD